MATLTTQEIQQQNRGWVKIGDGVELGDITADGEQEVFVAAASNGIITDANPQTFEDTSFLVGDSPATLDVNAALGRNATQITIINDGVGDFTVALSNDNVAFGDEHTMKNGETYSFDNLSVDAIRVTHVADSAYRVVVI